MMVLVGLTSACASVPKRTPLPEALASKAIAPGGDLARQWGDVEPAWAESWFSMPEEQTRTLFGGIMGAEHDYLAISGIAGRSVSSMIRTQGIGNMYEIYLLAKRDGLDYHLAYIPDSFEDEPEEAFDPVYMKKLFDLGYESAKSGYPWKAVPPGYDLEAELDR